LRSAASARNVSPEELGSELLGGAIEKIEPATDGPDRNRRRGELIDKKYHSGGLTAAEVQELEVLQVALEQQLAPLDQKRLDWLRAMEERVQKLPVQ
ncbi:MAG: hypothetical protein JNM56_25670, partial [Planctomycetia bacterium]|nr:hypothetical protein [Planctomycetia bacterium]